MSIQIIEIGGPNFREALAHIDAFEQLRKVQEKGGLDEFLEYLKNEAENGDVECKQLLEYDGFQDMIDILTDKPKCKCSSSGECTCEETNDDCEESCDYYDKLTKALDIIRKVTGCQTIMGNHLRITVFLEESVDFKVKALNSALNTVGFFATNWRIVEVAAKICFQFDLEEI